MKISLTRNELARQFPFLRNVLIQEYDSDDTLFITGAEVSYKVHPFIKKYPSLIDIFTILELSFLKEMYERELTERKELSRFCHSLSLAEVPPYSNVVDVHIKNIRNKIKIHKLKFEVKTYRGLGYKLIEHD